MLQTGDGANQCAPLSARPDSARHYDARYGWLRSVHRAKTNARTCNILVVFLSALDLTFPKLKAFEVGTADYLNQPFYPAEVLVRTKKATHPVAGHSASGPIQSIAAQQKQIDEAQKTQRLAAENAVS